MSLGYSGLLADIYWTRVVQYFGTKHRANAKQYLILEPLLEMTTTLDPKLLPAYEFGSVFLAQKPPEGAGNPLAAARLVEKGIRENPQAWRLYYDLGYIYWLELKDPAEGSRRLRARLKDSGRPPVDAGDGGGAGGARRRDRDRHLHVDEHPEQHGGSGTASQCA